MGAGTSCDFSSRALSAETAPLAVGLAAVCVFVNDHLDAGVIETLAKSGTRLIALRCAGYNNVDLAAVTIQNITAFEEGRASANEVRAIG